MALVTIKEILEKARREKYCVGAFDASTIEMAMKIVEAAEEKKSPVILMGLTPDLQGDMLDYWLYSLRKIAERASVPVCLHLDHAKDMDFLKKCVDSGFTSVMYDASVYPLEENIRLTKEAVDYAHAHGVTVEAELGHVGDGIVSGELKSDEDYDNPDDYLTNPDEMKRFIEETGVDCLAVAVGTSHGVYVHTPKLHFDRLDTLNDISTVPMVMHGGSGTPDDQIKKAVEKGICKLNIYSEMLSAYYGELKKKLEESGTLAIWVSKANERPLEALKQVVLEKIDLVGSANKA
ncbi:MAG: class II fructose-bisphosphate aldolase [Lachnospiraceae bacterium]|nr:class II fructose-bisphosphate aldolase [Lachnospiraceae bacterium]